MERVLIADRQALLTAAALKNVEDYEPVDVDACLDDWDAALAHDPADTEEARTESRVRELMEVA